MTAAQVDDQARRLFAAGQHDDALALLRAAAVHPTISAAVVALEGQLKNIERARVTEERRLRRAATLGKVGELIADRRAQAVAGVLVVGIALTLVTVQGPAIDTGEVDRRSGVRR